MLKTISLFFKGMAMGAADLVPGVSGGTIAFITGIYEELIATLQSLNFNALKLLLRSGIGAFWKHINGNFLLTLLSGIGLTIVILAKAISFALENYQEWVFAFFFGLVAASFFVLLRQVGKYNFSNILGLFVSAVLAFWITTLNPMETTNSLSYIFISGAIAICAMILPGISGSFILLLLGSYELVLNAVKSFDAKLIVVFALGCITGLLSFSHLLNFLFRNYKSFVMAVLTGFLLGSLNKLWPWKETVSYRLNSKGEEVPFIQNNLWPETDQLMPGVLFIFVGVLLILGFELLNRKDKPNLG